MSTAPTLTEAQARMKKAVDHTFHEFNSIHTGKATPAMVETVMVEAYGQMQPLKQCAAITTPDARLIQIQPWDAGIAKSIAKGIIDANLGFNPIIDGKVIRIPLPDMSRERRQEFVKNAHRLAEEGRVSVRHIRQEAQEGRQDFRGRRKAPRKGCPGRHRQGDQGHRYRGCPQREGTADGVRLRSTRIRLGSRHTSCIHLLAL